VEKTEFGGSVKRIGDDEMEKRQVGIGLRAYGVSA
jgi:hypothetical protein